MKVINLHSMVTSLGRYVYTLIGPHNSTVLAHSWIGRCLYRFMNDSLNTIRVYNSKFGIKLLLFPQEAQSFGISYLGVINPFETNVLSQILHKGDVVLDVGTYVDGWYTLLTSKLVGKNGKVYAFEPIPSYFKRLQQNIRINKVSNVVLNNCALASRGGKRHMYIANESSSFYQAYAESRIDALPQEILVPTQTIDAYIRRNKITQVNFIKIDVEGAEMDVLKGAVQTLKRFKPDMLLELIDDNVRASGHQSLDILTFMKKAGYTPYCITKKGLSVFTFGIRPTHNVFFRFQ